MRMAPLSGTRSLAPLFPFPLSGVFSFLRSLMSNPASYGDSASSGVDGGNSAADGVGNGGQGGQASKSSNNHSLYFDYMDEPVMCKMVYENSKNGGEGEGEGYDAYISSTITSMFKKFFNKHIDDSFFKDIYSPVNVCDNEMYRRERGERVSKLFRKRFRTGDGDQIAVNDDNLHKFDLRKSGGGGVSSSNNSNGGSGGGGNAAPSGHSLPYYQEGDEDEDEDEGDGVEGAEVIAIHDVPSWVCSDRLKECIDARVKEWLRNNANTTSTNNSNSNDSNNDSNNGNSNLDGGKARKRIPYKLTSSGPYYLSGTMHKKSYSRSVYMMVKGQDEADDMVEVFTDGVNRGRVRKTGGVQVRFRYRREEEEEEEEEEEVDVEGGANGKDGGEGGEGVEETFTVSVKDGPSTKFKFVRGDLTKDFEMALSIGEKLDEISSIPPLYALKGLLSTLGESSSPEVLTEGVKLDVAVAYLRVVHLYDYYGCKLCCREGDIIDRFFFFRDGSRVANEGEGRENDKDDEREAYLTNLRFSNSQEALSQITKTSEMIAENPSYVAGDEVDELSTNLKSEIESITSSWMKSKGQEETNKDGFVRVRCKVKGCKKLFRDWNFFKKHLKNKHSWMLKFQTDKAHDDFMKICWESASCRPCLPPMLVHVPDFGLYPVPIKGTFTEPTMNDPHPAIVKAEEDRMREKYERHERRRREYEASGDNSGKGSGNYNGERNTNAATFVDVDDVKNNSKEVVFDSKLLESELSDNKKRESEDVEGAGNGEKKRKKKKRRRLD